MYKTVQSQYNLGVVAACAFDLWSQLALLVMDKAVMPLLHDHLRYRYCFTYSLYHLADHKQLHAVACDYYTRYTQLEQVLFAPGAAFQDWEGSKPFKGTI
jgi:hypothetical protein